MSAPALRILGIDPGLRVTGFGVIDKTGQQARLRHQRLHPYAASRRAARAPRRPSSTGSREVIADAPPAAGRGRKGLRQRQSRNRRCCSARRAAPRSAPRCSRACRSPSTPRCRSSRRWSATATRSKEQVQEMVKRLLELCRRPRAPTRPTRSPAPSATRTAGWGWARSPTAGFRVQRGRLVRRSRVIGRIAGTLAARRTRRRWWSTCRASATRSTCR